MALSIGGLSACGGGGSGSEGAVSDAPPSVTANGASAAPAQPGSPPAPTQTQTSTPAAAPTAAPTPAPASAISAEASCAIPDFQQQLLQQINALRTAGTSCNGLPAPAVAALQWNSALFNAGLVESQDMVINNFFGHTGSNGKQVGDRVSEQGYRWSFVGENIAAGQGSVAAVVDGWMKSTTGHCENIMNASAQDIGVACVAKPKDPNNFGSYWTMVLAKPLP
jgi:uncharacterized protein YkwD